MIEPVYPYVKVFEGEFEGTILMGKKGPVSWFHPQHS